MRVRTKPALGVMALVSASVAAVWFFGVQPTTDEANAASPEATDRDEAPLIEMVPVQVAPLATHIRATTNLVAEIQVSVVAEVEGRITKLAVDEGEIVKVGDLLATLDRKIADQALSSAAIRLEHADSMLRRAAQLAGQQLLSSEELEQLTTDRDLAKRSVADARTTVARTRVRSPVAGRVTKREVVVGRFVRPGDPMFEVTDFDLLIAEIHIPERDALVIEPGRAVEFVLQAKPDVVFSGHVRRVASVVDPQSGTVEVTIEADDPPPEVRSGSFVAVAMVRESHTEARWLPREALVVGARGAHVFVVVDGKARRRSVVTGEEEGGRVHIIEGLEVGEPVVFSGQGALRDGSSVRVKSPSSGRG